MNILDKKFIAKVSLIITTRMLGLFMILPIFAIYGQNYTNSTPFLIGLSLGIYGLTQALLQIPYGYLSDKFGRKPILLIGILLFMGGSIIAAMSNDIYGIVIGRALQGSGAIAGVLMAWTADFIVPRYRAKVNGFIGMLIGISFMLAITIGPIIASNFGINGVFWSIAILASLSFIIALSMPSVKINKQHKISISNFKKILITKYLAIDFSVFILHLLVTSIFVAIPLLFEDNDWFNYLIVIMIAFIFMIPLIIIAEKKQKQQQILLFSISLIIISQILLYTFQANYFLIISTLIIFFIAFNTTEALLPSMLAHLTDINNKDIRGLVMGFFSTSQFLGAFSGGIIAGLIHNFNILNNIFLFNIIISSIWFLTILRRKKWQV